MSTTETTPVVASAPQAEVQPEPTATNENQLLERKELAVVSSVFFHPNAEIPMTSKFAPSSFQLFKG